MKKKRFETNTLLGFKLIFVPSISTVVQHVHQKDSWIKRKHPAEMVNMFSVESFEQQFDGKFLKPIGNV